MLRSELKPGTLFTYVTGGRPYVIEEWMRVVGSGNWDVAGSPEAIALYGDGSFFPKFNQDVHIVLQPSAEPEGTDPLQPNHYKRLTPEPFDVVDAWDLDYYRATALKYIARAGHKDPTKYAEDLRKAVVYLERGAKNFEESK